MAKGEKEKSVSLENPYERTGKKGRLRLGVGWVRVDKPENITRAQLGKVADLAVNTTRIAGARCGGNKNSHFVRSGDTMLDIAHAAEHIAADTLDILSPTTPVIEARTRRWNKKAPQIRILVDGKIRSKAVTDAMDLAVGCINELLQK